MSAKTPRKKSDAGVAASPVAAAPPFVAIGQVGRPHGLRGAFFVSGRDGIITPGYGEIRIGPTLATAKAAEIQASHMQAGRPLLVCSLAGDRNAAAALTGHLIFAQRAQIEAQRGDNILWSDLEGAEVLDAAGVVLGKVHHVYNAGASDIIEVRSGERSVDIPLVPEYIAGASAVQTEADGRRCLQLQVLAAVFAEVWNDQTARPNAEGEPPLA